VIDPEGEVTDALRTLWVWLLISSGIGPAVGFIRELGYAFGLSVPLWSDVVLTILVAGGLVGIGERRYGRLFGVSILTLVIWIGATELLGVADPRVYGSPRLIAARFLLWLAALSVAIILMWSLWSDREATEHSQPSETGTHDH